MAARLLLYVLLQDIHIENRDLATFSIFDRLGFMTVSDRIERIAAETMRMLPLIVKETVRLPLYDRHCLERLCSNARCLRLTRFDTVAFDARDLGFGRALCSGELGLRQHARRTVASLLLVLIREIDLR
jgi:hypothetical protein